MSSKLQKRSSEKGAVSLFVVIFSALLLVVITVSFVSLMIRDQEEASQADLSQSAYDASQAGTEDAKRLLLIKGQCDAGLLLPGSTACKNVNLVDWSSASPSCDMVEQGLGLGALTTPGSGTAVQTSTTDTSGKSYDQSYTCVKIALNTNDYAAVLQPNQSTIVPLVPEANRNYNYMKISWFTQDDLNSSVTGTTNLAIPNPIGTTLPLFAQASWPKTTPPVLRLQFMQVGSNGFALTDFDNNGPGNQSDTNTVFLYPQTVGAQIILNAVDSRRVIPSNLQSAQCTNLGITTTYACSAIIMLPDPVGGGARASALARITSYYNSTHFSISLYDGIPSSNNGNLVQFGGVEPEIDSTGRTANLFRRVVTRVSMTNSGFPYPDAAVELSGNLCKDFSVTDTTYIAGTCTP